MDFPETKFKPIKDRYSKARGGSSKNLFIACATCEEPALVYQKDGPGRLLRMYADRIVWPPDVVEANKSVDASTIKEVGALACNSCEAILANPMVYSPENRPAYRLLPGTIHAYRSADQADRRTRSND